MSQSVPPSYAPATATDQRPFNVLSIIAFVLSIVGVSLVGVILGHIALSQLKRTGERGRGFAIAGLIIGYVGIAVGIIVAIVWIAVLGGAISSGNIITY
jgi:Domain of unknown function (DUF4190)